MGACALHAFRAIFCPKFLVLFCLSAKALNLRPTCVAQYGTFAMAQQGPQAVVPSCIFDFSFYFGSGVKTCTPAPVVSLIFPNGTVSTVATTVSEDIDTNEECSLRAALGSTEERQFRVVLSSTLDAERSLFTLSRVTVSNCSVHVTCPAYATSYFVNVSQREAVVPLSAPSLRTGGGVCGFGFFFPSLWSTDLLVFDFCFLSRLQRQTTIAGPIRPRTCRCRWASRWSCGRASAPCPMPRPCIAPCA